MNVLDVPLERLDGDQVKRRNRAIRALSNHVYTVMGMNIFWVPAQKIALNAVQVDARYLGQEFVFYVDLACVDALIADRQLQLESMSPDAIKLLVLSLENFPVEVLDLRLVDSYPQDNIFECVSYDNSKSLGWRIAFDLRDDFPLEQLLQAFSVYLKGVMTHPLMALKVDLPLVACVLDIPSDELRDIEEGDLLFLEGS